MCLKNPVFFHKQQPIMKVDEIIHKYIIKSELGVS